MFRLLTDAVLLTLKSAVLAVVAVLVVATPALAAPSLQDMTDALKAASHPAAAQRLRASAPVDLVPVAQERQRRLATLAHTAPSLVLKHALTTHQRGALPASVQPFVETRVTLVGPVQVFHADYPDGGSAFLYELQPPTGGPVTLYRPGAMPEIVSETRLEVRGVRVEDAVVLDAPPIVLPAPKVSAIAAAIPSATRGEQRVVVILLANAAKPQGDATQDATRANVFGAGVSVSNFYREMSYGQAWLGGEVVGPFVIPESPNCNWSQMAIQGDAAATAAGVNLSAYPRRVYGVPEASNCPWGGLGTVGGSTSRAWIRGDLISVGIYFPSHELGHNFGLYHSHSLRCKPGGVLAPPCWSDEYGDRYDTMGSGYRAHFNAAQKYNLGWLGTDGAPALTTVTKSGTYTLEPYATPTLGPKALRVRLGPDSSTWFYAEYRTPYGFDAYMVEPSADTRNGVLVHQAIGTGGVYWLDMSPADQSWATSALQVGQTEVLTPSIRFTTNSVGATAQLTVELDGTPPPPCTLVAPAITLEPSHVTLSAGGIAQYQAHVTNSNQGCGPLVVHLVGTAPSGWITPNVTATVPVNGTIVATVPVTSPHATVEGDTPITVRATNGAAPGLWSEASAIYTVEASLPPSGNDTTQTFVPTQLGKFHVDMPPYRCSRWTGGTSVLRIVKVTGTTPQVEEKLASVPVGNPVRNVPFTLRCQVTPTTISLYLNGVLKVTRQLP